MDKLIVILIIAFYALFSTANIQQTQAESRDAEAYNNRGNTHADKGQYDQAISDYTKALEINPQDAIAYCNRGIVYYFRKEYGKSWENVKKARSLGYQIDPKFLDELRKASGRQN